RGEARQLACLEPGEQGRAHAAEKTRQALVARLTSGVLPVLLEEGGAQCLRIPSIQSRQFGWLRQAGNLTPAHRTMPTALGRLLIAEVQRQTAAQALVAFEQREHGLDSGNLAGLVSTKVLMQLTGQRVQVEAAVEHGVDLGHLL